MRSVIFDLDGTLADTSGDLINAANHCFRGLGLGDLLDPQRDADTAVRGGRAMLTLGFERANFDDEGEIDRQYPVLLEAYRQDIATHSYMYDGAMEAVEALKSAGFGVGICTNKPEGLAESLLQELGVRDAFQSLIGADTLPVRKPDPLPFHRAIADVGGARGRGLLVGDTLTDYKTARAADMPIVLVTFGPAGDGVKEMQADAFIDKYSDLLPVAEALIPEA